MAAQDFIQQLMGLVQLGLQQREQERLGAAQRGQMLAIFQQAARQTTNPALVTALRDQFAPLTGMTTEQLDEIARNTVPQADVVRLDAATRGYGALTPEDRSLIDKVSGITTMTGLRPEEVVRGAMYTQQPREDILKGIRISEGLDETAAQEKQRTQQQTQFEASTEQQQWQFEASSRQRATEFLTQMSETYRQFDLDSNYRWATHRLGWAQLMQNGVLQSLGLRVNAEKASQVDWNVKYADVVDIIKERELARRALLESKGKMSREELAEMTNSINMMTQMLVDWGIEEGAPSQDPWVPPLPMGPRSPQPGAVTPGRSQIPPDTTGLPPNYLQQPPMIQPDSTYNNMFSPYLPQQGTGGRLSPRYLRPEDLSMPSRLPFFDYLFRPGWSR